MSRHGNGMQTNVAKALGYTNPGRFSPESISCGTCRSTIEFRTDEIGRVVEVCPKGCHRRRLTPNGDPIESERTKRLLESAAAENKALSEKLKGRFGSTFCHREECGQEFVKHSGNQKYCSRPCANTTNGLKHNGGTRNEAPTLGIAAGRFR